jgi:2-polyprenyl-6-hydroxyphenyl methylase / 3-demethylubiquinone-9 3-methyltransferase
MKTPENNFDPAELAKFSALAQRWWSPDSEFRPLHAINPLRLVWINTLSPLSGKTVLDVGCGGGILSEAMAKKGATVTGIDLAIKPLQVATLHAQQSGVAVDYKAISAEALSESKAGTYDVVTCMEMLEHVPNPELVVRACARLAKPGAWVFFSTINRTPLSWLFAILGVEYVLGMLPKGTHSYSKFIRPDELKAWATDAGLALQDQRGLGYNPLTKQFRLHRFLGVGYLLAFQRKI